MRGIDYHVNEWGDPSNRLLLMLHGWGDAGSTFQFVVDELTADWFVIAPDWRGFGRTTGRAASYWFPDYLADLDALLAIYSPDNPAAILGHSMGGNIAGLYAGVFSDRVEKFINVEGFGLADRDPEDAPDELSATGLRKGRTRKRLSKLPDSYAELAQTNTKRRNPRT